MFLTRISVAQPVFATMMMLALAVLGLTSYRQLNVDQFPNVDFPIVTVTTVYEGATPEAVEREVTKKIEESINTVQGIRHVESTSQEGLSNIVVMFRVGVSSQVASQDIRGKVAAIRGLLPREIEEPVVQRLDANALPIVSVSVEAPASRRRPRPRSPTSS
jgi:HAE1 family hydrophobic/amphiphilic exporter-1